VFCIFTPTDADLRHALFAAGDRGLMMFGLINQLSKPKDDADGDAGTIARVETYNRSRDSKDVYAHGAFTSDSVRDSGFWFEVTRIPGQEGEKFPVWIHRFVVIDAETAAPTVYTGSANMSGGSLHQNDENILEIKGRPAFARAYLAEFMRLYEHYRARARQDNDEPPGGRRRERQRGRKCHEGFALAHTSCWADDDYKPGSPESKSRVAMARPLKKPA
jgi:phosphatidylserine/phosphatidylglycerophosphate/cardiolipin synthase-like enzyme